MSDNEEGYTTPVSDFEDDTTQNNKQEIMKLLGPEIMCYDKFSLYSLNGKNNVKSFINLINTYAYNAPLNQEHLISLKKEFNNKSETVSDFTIVFKEDDDDYYLYDGHHRAEVIRTNPVNMCPDCILIKSYNIESFSHPKAIKIFRELNKIKPYFDIEITEMCKRILDRLEQKFNNNHKIITDATKMPKYPFMSRSKFTEKLQLELIKVNDSKGTVNEDEIYNKLMKINDKLKIKFLGTTQQPLSLASYCKNNNKTSKQKKEIQKKYEGIGCFLGIDKHYEYLSELNN
jgi:hypothetical protein